MRNQKEINEKIKKSLQKHFSKIDKIKHKKSCPICEKDFTTRHKKKRLCSLKCANIFLSTSKEYSESQKIACKNNGGFREGGGKAKIFDYTSLSAGLIRINVDEIRVAKVLDSLSLQWIRNTKGFLYTDQNGERKKYYPDFYIETLNIYVEYKGWVTDKMNHKMNSAIYENNMLLIIIYGDDKRYRNLGINITEIEKNNTILINKLNELAISNKNA